MATVDETARRLGEIEQLTVSRDAPLSQHTRFGIGGPASILAEAPDPASFVSALQIARSSGLDYVVIGGGTNLIASDDGFRGVVLKLTARSIAIDGERVTADAGAVLQDLVDTTIDHGLQGLETMTGIPGFTGAAVYGNAGAYGHSISERITSVEFYDGSEIRRIDNAACQFHYRESIFKKHKDWIIFGAGLGMTRADAAVLRATADKILSVRNAKYPPTMKCAGSIFKNFLLADLPGSVAAQVPKTSIIEGKVPSAWFLEQVGAKGMREGGILVADYHANLIYNAGDGTARELRSVIGELKRRVRDRFGIEVEEEVQYVGWAAINLEAVFALLVLCSTGFSLSNAPRSEREDGKSWMFLLLIIPAALLWTVTIPLVSDDFVHIGYALHFTPDKIVGLFTIPAGDHFFRPLGYLSYALDARWAGNNPALWHLATLLIHFANCLLVYVVARQAGLARFFAATAAVIFGIHGSRPEAVTWIACRFDLIATLFVLATLTLFRRGNYVLALIPAFLALISKESAYVLPVLLVIIADQPFARATLRRAAPFAALTAAVFLYRWHLLSGIGGYQTASHTPAIFNFSLLRTANALLLRLWATLFFPINWIESAQWWLWIALGIGVAGYAVMALNGGRQRRTLEFLLFTFVAALPVQQLLLIGPDLEKSRVLYLPSAGFALFLAAVLETLRKPGWRVPAAIAIIVFQTACLEHNLVTWRGVAEVARQACDSVAASLTGNSKTVTVLDLPNVLRGVYFFHKGMPDCLEVGHGIDIRRVREEDADIVFHWDPGSETVDMRR